MFLEVKKQLKEYFESISASQEKLFYVDIDREKAWECYLKH